MVESPVMVANAENGKNVPILIGGGITRRVRAV